jgi:hypothetical protein
MAILKLRTFGCNHRSRNCGSRSEPELKGHGLKPCRRSHKMNLALAAEGRGRGSELTSIYSNRSPR